MVKRITAGLLVSITALTFLASGLYFPGISSYPIHLWLLGLLCVLELSALLITDKLVIRTRVFEFVIILSLLLVNAIFAEIINGIFNVEILGLIFLTFIYCVAIYCVVSTQQDLSLFLNIYVVIVLISALVEIGQFFNLPFCCDLWLYLNNGSKMSQALAAERYLGLAPNAIIFGYYCSAAFTVVLFKKYTGTFKIIKPILLAILLFAILTNNTRSAILSAGIVTCVWLCTRDISLLKRIVLISLLVVTVFILAMGTNIFGRFDLKDGSAQSRIPMFLTALNHVVHHPFGMGIYVSEPGLIVGADDITRPYVEIHSAHNFIGHSLASYGFIGLFLIVDLYVRMVFIYIKEARCTPYKNEYFTILVAIFSLLFNACFHNAYIMNGDFSTLFFIGLLLTATKFKKKEFPSARIR